MKLYKYYGVTPYSLKVLKNYQVFFNTPNGFNDPFDMNSATGNIPKTFKEYGEHLKLTEQDLANRLDSYKRFYGDQYGVFCLTETYDNILMWSHYADSHKGFCVEFSEMLPELIYGVNSVKDKPELKKIYYVNNRPSNQILNFKDALITQKAEDWYYEREQRLVLYSEET